MQHDYMLCPPQLLDDRSWARDTSIAEKRTSFSDQVGILQTQLGCLYVPITKEKKILQGLLFWDCSFQKWSPLKLQGVQVLHHHLALAKSIKINLHWDLVLAQFEALSGWMIFHTFLGLLLILVSFSRDQLIQDRQYLETKTRTRPRQANLSPTKDQPPSPLKVPQNTKNLNYRILSLKAIAKGV